MTDSASSFGAQALKSSGPSISLIESKNVGVGNYKGVMLCNRPFGGTVAAANQTAVADKTSFTCGVVSEKIGQTVLVSSKEKFRLQRSKKDSVLSKHKKWLSDLQKTKDELESQYVDELRAKEESKAKFSEQEAKLRQAARGILGSADSKSSNQQQDSMESTEKDIQSKMLAAESKKSGGGGGKLKSSKPAWAMTEEKAQEKGSSDDDEFEDIDGLLDFAQNLDYEKYVNDVEVQSMMERLRRKIKELEKEVAQDDAREMDAEERAKKRHMLSMMGEAAAAIESGTEGAAADENVSYAAKELLQSDADMQAVHSAKSVTAMLRAARDKVVGKDRFDGKERKSCNANEPVIVVHDPNEGRLDGKNTVSNLPYIHRNPAV